VYPYADRQVKEEPRRVTHEISIQKDYEYTPKVEKSIDIQTTLRQKDLAEMAIQT